MRDSTVHPRVMNDVRSIPRAEAAALGGIQRAEARMVRAAADVAHKSLENRAANVEISEEGRSLALPLSGELAARPPHDLPEALIDSEIAAHEQAANLKVLATAFEMSETLLDIKR
jgi:hypothetical protein